MEAQLFGSKQLMPEPIRLSFSSLGQTRKYDSRTFKILLRNLADFVDVGSLDLMTQF